MNKSKKLIDRLSEEKPKIPCEECGSDFMPESDEVVCKECMGETKDKKIKEEYSGSVKDLDRFEVDWDGRSNVTVFELKNGWYGVARTKSKTDAIVVSKSELMSMINKKL